MADGSMTWEDQNRRKIDRTKRGGPESAIALHTKGMLAGEVALQAMYEYFMERANGDMNSEDAIFAGQCRAFLFRLKAYHCDIDNATTALMGQPVARDGSR